MRAAADEDAEGLVALIGACFAEYEGCVLDTEHEAPHLLRVATHFAHLGGRAWVAEAEGSVVASVGCRPAASPGGLELQMLYVAAPWRRRGLGGRLVALVEDEGRARAAAFVDLWTDTRFADAHRLYRSLGYAQLPERRELHDLSASREYHFTKRLA
ncbi:MAG TPA: GNAT family N-acetyltransferase [Acidimicrobiales bacterium]|nr:GNAT family N-acetyltransferase [Acidimicrobiales bacterium]